MSKENINDLHSFHIICIKKSRQKIQDNVTDAQEECKKIVIDNFRSCYP